MEDANSDTAQDEPAAEGAAEENSCITCCRVATVLVGVACALALSLIYVFKQPPPIAQQPPPIAQLPVGAQRVPVSCGVGLDLCLDSESGMYRDSINTQCGRILLPNLIS